ncbi:ABC transporter permease [Natroniella acetigena]|uniref:ABC transporter permease n=1 Tax=Natroniella acetigena TaxID=52004 RepID=UPI00200A1B41|nr:ABC transporter permease [Natroniella acetigena]MCK8828487.1 ABC transporter permease [Natroniella acetigena]
MKLIEKAGEMMKFSPTEIRKELSFKKIMNILFDRFAPLILPVLLLIIWQTLALSIDNPVILPTVDRVLRLLSNPTASLIGLGSIFGNTGISIARVLLGYTAAIIIGVPLGIMVGYSQKVEKLAMVFVNIFRPIAPLAWVPLVMAWFGVASLASVFDLTRANALYGLLDNMKVAMIFIIFVGAFFPIFTNAIYGVNSVRKSLLDSAVTLGAGRKEILLKVLLPGSLPSIVTGLRVGLGIAWMCLVSAEMLPGSLAGLGYLITHAYTIARTDVVITGMIVISIVGGLFDYSFQLIEKKFFKWQSLSN